MRVEIVQFPATPVALVQHRDSPAREHDTVRKLVAWKLERGLRDPVAHRHYGVHYSDSRLSLADAHRVDFCLSFDGVVGANPYGVVAATIPALRCARARDIGSRNDNRAAAYLFESWLPQSGERTGAFPVFFHYVNVGPQVSAADMITDVYLPLA